MTRPFTTGVDVDSEYRFVVDYAPDPADLVLLEDGVSAAAVAAGGVGEEHEFAVFVRDESDRVIAGVSGTMWGGYCELHAMWVDERARGRGLARRLMAGAEAAARERGRGVVAFLAYDLLARGLYERLGYETVGVIDGFPAGSAARWFQKRL